MPELPEVETLRRELSRLLPGKIIASTTVRHPKLVAPLSDKQFERQLKGEKIASVTRRAKMLVISFDSELLLVFHLKMTGQLIFVPPEASKKKVVVGGHPQPGGLDNLPNRFTHIVFNFTDGSTLYFNDMRRFGWAKLYDNHSFEAATSHVGIEPLSRGFTLEIFRSLIGRYPKRSIKQVLLDQTIIAGVGNIYADESCFLARVNPTRLVGSLSKKEGALLHQHLLAVLKHSIKMKGTSAKNYVRSTGERGGFTAFLNVYGKGNDQCPRCGDSISKIKFRGRGTHFCPQCQK